MTYARRTDTTHAPIRDALRKVYGDYAVIDLCRTGDGLPDLLVTKRNRTLCVECKTPTRKDGGVKPSKFTDAQRRRLITWEGDEYLVVTSPEHAIAEVGAALART